MVGVFQNLGLRRVTFAPVPFLLQFVGERIGILHALDIAARPGITVPVPGAADIAALLVDPPRFRAAYAACTFRQIRRRPQRHRSFPGLRCGLCRKWIARRTSCSRSLGFFGYCTPAFYRRIKSASDKTAAPGCISGVAYRVAYFARRNVLARDS